MIVTLEVSDNKSRVKRVTLKSDAIIGRSADCNLRIASSQVSRHHCKIRVTDTQVCVKDLGSSNGTFLNGEAIPPNKDFPISSGAQIAVGPVRFVARFELAQNTLGSPGSTREMPVVPEGQTAAEALAQHAEPAQPLPEQVAGGAVAGAMAAAAKAEQQAPQQIDELVDLVKSPGAAEEEPPDEDEQTPADAPDEAGLEVSEPESALKAVEVALPVVPAADDDPDADATVDWTDNAPGPPSDIRPSTTAAPVAKSVGSSLYISETDEKAPAVPAEPVEEEVLASAEVVDAQADVPSFEFEEAPGPVGDFAFIDATDEAADDPQTSKAEYAQGEYLSEEVDEEQSEEEEYEEEEIEVGAEQSDQAEEEPASPKKGRKRSLFGMFGRKNQAEAAAADEEPAEAEPEADGEQEWEYEETEDADSEEYEYEYEYEEVPADESAEDETVNVSEDEIASFLGGEGEAEAPPAQKDDGSLGDFLKQLGDG